MKNRFRYAALLLCMTLLTAFFSGCAQSDGGEKNDGYKIAVVPKMISSGWFQRMKEGVDAYNQENNTRYFFGGSTEGADQAAYLEQLLAEEWDAICVVPFDSESIAPLLKKARDEGILIITHEADTMDSQCYDYDIEAFLSEDLGKSLGQRIVKETGGKGTYFQMLGSMNSVTHRDWCDAADAYISSNADMTCLGRFETHDDSAQAYNQTKELLQAHPEITAIMGCCSTDIAGASRAVEEMGYSGKIAVTGVSLTSLSGDCVRSGTVSAFSLWDPSDSGKAMLSLAEQVLSQGEAFDKDRCSLSVPGYEKLTVKGNVFYGNACADVTVDNLDDFDF